jgi:putative sterol carrier protein
VPTFPSPEWLNAFRDAINANDELRQAARDWQGDITLVVYGEPDKNVPFDSWAWFDLQRDDAIDARIVTPDEGERAAFVISAPYSIWKDVLLGKLEPIKGMTQGKLRLSGDLVLIRDNVKTVGELVSTAVGLATKFPDD